MVLHLALAILGAQNPSHQPPSLTEARALLAAARGMSSTAKYPRDDEEGFWVDDPNMGNPRYEIGDSFVMYDPKNLKFKAIAARSNDEMDGEPLKLEDAKSGITSFYGRLNTGLELKITEAKYEERDHLWQFQGTQSFQGVPMEGAHFRAEVNRDTHCIELLDLGYRSEPPTESKPQESLDVAKYWLATHVFERTGASALEFLHGPILAIADPYSIRRSRISPEFGDYRNLSDVEVAAADACRGTYAYLAIVKDLDSDKGYTLRSNGHSNRLLTLNPITSLGRSRQPGRTEWTEIRGLVHLITNKSHISVEDAALHSVNGSQGKFDRRLLLQSANRTLILGFSSQEGLVRLRHRGKDEYARPNTAMLSGLKRLFGVTPMLGFPLFWNL